MTQDLIQDLHIVAITEDIETHHFETDEPIILQKGQVGTVVTEFDGTAFEVEFANNDGSTYAMETIAVNKLMRLHDELITVA